MKSLFIAAATLTASLAHAGEVWEGTGKLYSLDRSLLSDYTLEVQVDDVSASEQQVKVTIRDQGGQVIHTDSCTSHLQDPKSWKKDCSGGLSSGYLLDYGLGIDYYEAKDGKAYATNIVLDGEDKIRLFRTELVGGRAQKFFTESLTKRAK